MRKSLITLLIISLYGCGDSGGDKTPTPNPTPTPSSYLLTGDFQKGPFIIGSEITIQEFDANLVATGDTYHTEMLNNAGHYQIDINLTEEIVEVSADGYYFNEISGQLSNSQLRLSALANVSGNENVNVNILTHLSKKRIKTLVSEGKEFSVAKKQAEEEVQNLFNFISANWEINNFDRMNISEYGDNNSYLLVVSAIIQNISMSTPQLSEYIERLAQDLAADGLVNDSSLLESISVSSQVIDLSVVRTNLINRYNELGEPLNLPDFESLLNRKPVANAGLDLSGLVGSEATLDGSLSTDIDNDSLTYNWTLVESPEGSAAILNNEDSESPTFIPDMLGSYIVGLTVHDGKLSSEIDYVTISPENQLPVADAGRDFSIIVGEPITIDGSNSYDPEGDELTYLWSNNISDLSSSSVVWELGVVSPPDGINHFDRYGYPDQPKIEFTLVVKDSQNLSSSHSITGTYIANFTDNNDGTVSDGFGNMWQQYGENIVPYISSGGDYPQEPTYCSNLTLGQFEDWRIPQTHELIRLVDQSSGSPTINNIFFPNTASNNYLTVTRAGLSYGFRYSVDFSSGLVSYPSTTEQQIHLRCIR
tara:strand:- start:4481 stop:6256 length:1776 start_codon:yes stop_codon:yes gene_type:complete